MDANYTILRNLEEHLNVSGADAFEKLAAIPQYLLEDQLILASAHLFVKNIASIYMRWLFLQPLSDVEGHQVVGSFAPFMKVRGLGVNEVLEMWKQESKSALKFARGDSERETRMRMRINRLRREIESEYFKWHNAANQGPEASSPRRPGNLALQNWPTKHIAFESIEISEPLDQTKSRESRCHTSRTIRRKLEGLMSKGLRRMKKYNGGEDPEREQPETGDDSVAESSAKLPKEVIDLVTPTPSES
ncbi:uncharacterized protein FIESC28_10307 [Fusarium coffeatum]|uniref:Uncharacterized protein n=1 Tax=Fusarium coffeatum TaxID=231269 RepID=A0A366QVI6_9HYPO|nr:uncharacterized protein FIESC28_10307 [Fusarium coffeatum]RBR08238.1 hypothetical protein FIESC28_10307 [Fusarium coffeatum]